MAKVIVYTSPICSKCLMAKKYLDSKGIQYEVRDISNAIYKREAMAMGAMSVPVIKVGEVVVIGFEKDMIDGLIASVQEG